MYCGHCGNEIPAASPFCRSCGAPTEHSRGGLEGTPEGEMYPLLATANLLRIRRQWDEATAKCVEVLRKYPNNASAHSLLGDICRDQGLLRDAAEWYKLALELDPSSRSDRLKLDRLVDELYQTEGKKQAEGKDLAAGFPLRRTLREWLLGARLDRPIGVGMVVVAVVLSMALLGMLAMQRTQPPPPNGDSFEIRLHRNRARPAPGQVATQPQPAQSQPTEAPAATTPISEAGYGQRQAQVLFELRQAAGRAQAPFSVDWVAIDPRDDSLTLTLTVPSPQEVQQSRAAVIAACNVALRAANKAAAGVTAFELRALLAPPLGQDSAPELAYVGTVAASRLSALGPDPTSEQLQGAFVDSWWHPSLRRSATP